MGIVRQASQLAFAGAGFSVGHDIWRFLRDNVILLIAAIALFGVFFMPYRAAKNMVKGYNDRYFLKTFFVTFLGNLLLLTFFGGLFSILMFGLIGAAFEGTIQSDSTNWEYAIAPAGILTTILVLWGFMAGRNERVIRMKRFQIEEENEEFLRSEGIRETGGKDITHYDSKETPLRLLEVMKDRISFMVVGSKGARAFIKMDEEGRFTEYVPAS